MQLWVRTVNEQGGFGDWCFDVVFEPGKIRDVIQSEIEALFIWKITLERSQPLDRT